GVGDFLAGWPVVDRRATRAVARSGRCFAAGDELGSSHRHQAVAAAHGSLYLQVAGVGILAEILPRCSSQQIASIGATREPFEPHFAGHKNPFCASATCLSFWYGGPGGCPPGCLAGRAAVRGVTQPI